MKTHLITFLTAVLSLCSCDDDGRFPSDPNYFPLAVGNYWEFVAIYAPTDGSIIEHREVVGKENIGGHTYFLVVSTWPPSSSRPSDSVYYRIANDGYVYRLRKYETGEMQEIRLNANDGDTWSYIYRDSEVTVTLTEIDIDLDSKSINDCKSYYQNVAGIVDDEYTIILAPQIGFAKEFYAWGGGYRLKRARIYGQVKSF